EGRTHSDGRVVEQHDDAPGAFHITGSPILAKARGALQDVVMVGEDGRKTRMEAGVALRLIVRGQSDGRAVARTNGIGVDGISQDIEWLRLRQQVGVGVGDHVWPDHVDRYAISVTWVNLLMSGADS